MALADKTPLWKSLTKEQEERVAHYTVFLTVDKSTGLIIAKRKHDSKYASGRSPRQAIEALDRV